MDTALLDHLLAGYRQLVAKVDAHVAAVEGACAEQLACRLGCDSCCRHLTVTAVEAPFLARCEAAGLDLPERLSLAAALVLQL